MGFASGEPKENQFCCPELERYNGSPCHFACLLLLVSSFYPPPQHCFWLSDYENILVPIKVWVSPKRV